MPTQTFQEFLLNKPEGAQLSYAVHVQGYPFLFSDGKSAFYNGIGYASYLPCIHCLTNKSWTFKFESNPTSPLETGAGIKILLDRTVDPEIGKYFAPEPLSDFSLRITDSTITGAATSLNVSASPNWPVNNELVYLGRETLRVVSPVVPNGPLKVERGLFGTTPTDGSNYLSLQITQYPRVIQGRYVDVFIKDRDSGDTWQLWSGVLASYTYDGGIISLSVDPLVKEISKQNWPKKLPEWQNKPDGNQMPNDYVGWITDANKFLSFKFQQTGTSVIRDYPNCTLYSASDDLTTFTPFTIAPGGEGVTIDTFLHLIKSTIVKYLVQDGIFPTVTDAWATIWVAPFNLQDENAPGGWRITKFALFFSLDTWSYAKQVSLDNRITAMSVDQSPLHSIWLLQTGIIPQRRASTLWQDDDSNLLPMYRSIVVGWKNIAMHTTPTFDPGVAPQGAFRLPLDKFKTTELFDIHQNGMYHQGGLGYVGYLYIEFGDRKELVSFSQLAFQDNFLNIKLAERGLGSTNKQPWQDLLKAPRDAEDSKEWDLKVKQVGVLRSNSDNQIANLLLPLILSTYGEFYNSSFDQAGSAIGLGIPKRYIDIAGIQAILATRDFPTASLIYFSKENEGYKDLSQLLTLLGLYFVQKRFINSEGFEVCGISLASIEAPHYSTVGSTIDDTLRVAGTQPRVDINDRLIVNNIKIDFLYRFGESAADSGGRRVVYDEASLASYGATKPIEVSSPIIFSTYNSSYTGEISSPELSTVAIATYVSSRWFKNFSRGTFTVEIETPHTGWHLLPSSFVLLTLESTPNATGTVGIQSALTQVVDVTHNHGAQARSKITLKVPSAFRTELAPCVTISSLQEGTTYYVATSGVEVSSLAAGKNSWSIVPQSSSTTLNPEGKNDVNWFKPEHYTNDLYATVWPRGNYAARVVTKVLEVTTNTIKFQDNVPLGICTFSTFNPATNQRFYTHLASGNPAVIGLSSTPAQVWE